MPLMFKAKASMSKRFNNQTQRHDRIHEEEEVQNIRSNVMRFNGQNQWQTLMNEATKNEEEESICSNSNFHEQNQTSVVMNDMFNYLNQGEGMINRRFSFQIQGEGARNRRLSYPNQEGAMIHKRLSYETRGHDWMNDRFNYENKGHDKMKDIAKKEGKEIKMARNWFRDQSEGQYKIDKMYDGQNHGQKMIDKRFNDQNQEQDIIEMRYNDDNREEEVMNKGSNNQNQGQDTTREVIIKNKDKDVIGDAKVQVRPSSSKARMKTLLDFFSEEDGYGGMKGEGEELLMMGESSEKKYIVEVVSRVLERIVRRNDEEVGSPNYPIMSNPNANYINKDGDGDDYGKKDGGVMIRRLESFNGRKGVPAISVSKYLERIGKYSGCSPCCFVVAFSYMDRLAHLYAQRLAITSLNVHRLFISSMLVAAKLLDDVHYNNAFYAKVGGIPNIELNKLELNLLFCLDFKVHVNQHLFESYWSHLEMQCQTIGYEFTPQNFATSDDSQEPIEDDP